MPINPITFKLFNGQFGTKQDEYEIAKWVNLGDTVVFMCGMGLSIKATATVAGVLRYNCLVELEDGTSENVPWIDVTEVYKRGRK